MNDDPEPLKLVAAAAGAVIVKADPNSVAASMDLRMDIVLLPRSVS